MRKFELTILGSNSAMPAYGRFPTSQVLDANGHLILIDCGEGSQIRMQEYKVKRSRIKYVLISHLHGDHLFGLPGFIGSLAHLSRKEPLYIFGPAGIKEYVETVLRLSESYISFDIIIEELEYKAPHLILEDKLISIHCFPVAHRIPTYGYLIKEVVGDLNIKPDSIGHYNLTIEEIKKAKKGIEILRDGQILPQEELTYPKPTPRSYGYCADSRVEGWSYDHLKGINTLYFETTYLHDMIEQAIDRGHATAKQAGLLAKELQVDRLIIGHYSSRYRNVDPLLDEAKAEFDNTVKGYDGLIINL